MKKNLIFGIIIFLILLLPAINTERVLTKEIQPASYNNDRSPLVISNGTIGCNGWSVSPVTIIFIYDHDVVKEIWFYINGSYQKYQEPFTILGQGKIFIKWYWIDFQDIRHNESPFIVKIDLTPPNVKISKTLGLNNQVTFTVTCDDIDSGIYYVEFYLDDELQVVDYESPYKWTWNGTGPHTVNATVYNNACLEQNSLKINTPRLIITNFFKLLIELLQKLL